MVSESASQILGADFPSAESLQICASRAASTTVSNRAGIYLNFAVSRSADRRAGLPLERLRGAHEYARRGCGARVRYRRIGHDRTQRERGDHRTPDTTT